MMDGLDMRETIRNWHEGRIYVTENRPVGGRVGSVVIIFDEDQGPEEQYPWCMTWLGEHAQESDMAFYSTAAGDNVVGPGISRCEYGGFMLTYPPLRLYDIWKDPFFNGARTKAERLLLAGLDYSEEKTGGLHCRQTTGRTNPVPGRYVRQKGGLPARGSVCSGHPEKAPGVSRAGRPPGPELGLGLRLLNPGSFSYRLPTLFPNHDGKAKFRVPVQFSQRWPRATLSWARFSGLPTAAFSKPMITGLVGRAVLRPKPIWAAPRNRHCSLKCAPGPVF